MSSRSMVRGVVLALLISAAVSAAQTANTAQPAKPPQTPTQQAAAMIADGKAEDALSLIDQILSQKPGDRDATMVKMDALVALERTPDAAALYDTFVGAAGKHDVPLARHLAQAELRHLAQGDRPVVKEAAADLLKQNGEEVPKAPTGSPAAAAAPTTPATPGPQAKPLPMQTPDQVLGNDKATDEQRLGALIALTAPVSPQARQGIRKALANPSMRVKTNAIDAIQRLELRDLAPDIKPLLSDEIILVKLKAAAALRQFGDHAGDEILQSTLKGDFLAGRLLVARALRADGDKTSWIPFIAVLLGSPRANERVLAAELLLDTDKSAEALKVLRANLDAQDPPVRADAARVLARQAGANPWDFLPLMKDPNPAVRVQAAGVLVRALPAAAAASKPAAASRPAAGRRK